MKSKSKKAGKNVFVDLGFDPAEAVVLQMRGKWEKFSLEMLITLEARLGRTVRVHLAA